MFGLFKFPKPISRKIDHYFTEPVLSGGQKFWAIQNRYGYLGHTILRTVDYEESYVEATDRVERLNANTP